MTHLPRRLVWLALALSLTGCSKAPPEEVESDATVPVTVAPAALETITATIRATGTVAPAPGADLVVVAPEAGRVMEIPKGEGDAVRRGDVLVRFEIPTTAAEAAKQKAEIARARARLNNAHASQARARDLFDRGVSARKDVEDADRDVAEAEADLASAEGAASAAETVAGRSLVRAPFDGIIAKRSHNPGDQLEAAASDPVLRLVDPRRLEVVASVSIADAARVRVGAGARVVDAAEGTPALKVIAHPAAVQPGTASVTVRLSFVGPPPYPVGAPVQVAIDAESHGPVVVVPASALVHEGGETFLFVVADQKAQRRSVTTGLESGAQVEVTGGVKPGEAVVTAGQNGLPDGAKVVLASGEAEDDGAEATERAGAKPDAAKK